MTGPAAATLESDRGWRIASPHATHVRSPAAAPAPARATSSIGKPATNALARFATTRPQAATRHNVTDGARSRGSTRFTTAKAPTWTTEMRPARPSVTPNRIDTSGRRNGVAANRVATADAPASSPSGARGRKAYARRVGPSTAGVSHVSSVALRLGGASGSEG